MATPPIRSAPHGPVVPAKPDPRWLSGRVGVAALLGGVLLGAAPLVGRVVGADPQALVGLTLVAFVGSGLWLAGVMILLRWTLRRGGWWYVASAALTLALVWWLLGLLPAVTGP